MCVCSNGFNTSIMHRNAYVHAWTKWFKGDLPTSLYIYILMRETDTCLNSLTLHAVNWISRLCSLWLKIEKEKKPYSLFPSFSTRKSSFKPINHACLYAQRSAASPLIGHFTPPRAVTRSRAAFRSHGKGCRCEPSVWTLWLSSARVCHKWVF